MKLAAGLVLALLSTAALSGGFYVQHSVAGDLPTLSVRRPLRSLGALFSNWLWLAGFVTGLAGWALYIVALALAPLSLVQAVSAGGVGLLALLVRLRGSPLSRRETAAVLAAVGGLLLVGLSLPAGTRSTAHTTAGPLAWVTISVALAGAAVAAARKLRPGAGLAIAGGLLYSAGDVATKAAVGGLRPVVLFALLVPACHGLAFCCVQLSFQRGAAMATAGVTTLLTNVLPIAAGLAVFGEVMPGGSAGILRWLGFAGAVIGATLLTGRENGHDEPVRVGAEPPRADAAAARGNPGWNADQPTGADPVTARQSAGAGELGSAGQPSIGARSASACKPLAATRSAGQGRSGSAGPAGH